MKTKEQSGSDWDWTPLTGAIWEREIFFLYGWIEWVDAGQMMTAHSRFKRKNTREKKSFLSSRTL